MRSIAAALTVFSGPVFAHPGHGAAGVHFHTWGPEHALLLVVVLAVLAYAVKK